MKALGPPTVIPRLASKLATAFFGHGEARRVINLLRFDNPNSCPFWTVLGSSWPPLGLQPRPLYRGRNDLVLLQRCQLILNIMRVRITRHGSHCGPQERERA